MDRGAWQSIVHGVARVRHDLATKLPPPLDEFGGKYIHAIGLCMFTARGPGFDPWSGN